MLKRILVPLDSSQYSSAATRMAASIAGRGPATVEEPVTLVGMGIVDLDQLPSGRFASVVPRDKIIGEAESEAKQLVEAFKKLTAELGVPQAQVETLSVSGSPFREIIRESVFSDLIVLGEKCSFPPVNQDYDTMHHLYHHASRPVVITESAYQRVERVVMLMDGTAPASRMMYNYVHLQPFPQAEVVLAYSQEEEQQFNLSKYFGRVRDYLASYHLNVRVHAFPGDAESAMAGVISTENAQVLALGIHREQFLERLKDPLGIRDNFATRLLRSTPASLFVVH